MDHSNRLPRQLAAGFGLAAAFLRNIRRDDYLHAKAEDFGRFTMYALGLAVLFPLTGILWDYVVDPANAGDTLLLRFYQCLCLLAWLVAQVGGVHSAAARLGSLVAPLAVELLLLEALSRLDGGNTYGAGVFLYYFIFMPFLLLAQPFFFAALTLLVITLFPMTSPLLGIDTDMNWGVYNAYMWSGFLPVVIILLLFEYLYWTVFTYRRQVERLAITDAMTQTANRAHFLSEATRTLAVLRRCEEPACVLFIDVDHFKRINDRYGHPVGDRVLRQMIDRVRPLLRASDLIARYGGEEFVVLLPRSDYRAGEQVAERMRQAVMEQVFDTGDEALAVTVSIGIADCCAGPAESEAPGQPQDIDELLRRADLALYAAKHAGRNRVMRYCEAHDVAPAAARPPARTTAVNPLPSP